MRPVFNADNTVVSIGHTVLMWDTANNRPVDYAGDLGRQYTQALAYNNMTVPDPYVPPTPPTEAQITQDAVNAMNRVTQRVLFGQENRLRALEGKSAITKAQFITAIKALT